MEKFENQLHECLEALVEGRWDLDECLLRYPEHADTLRPRLQTALVLLSAGAREPRAEWASQARERFLVVSGQRLREALEVAPQPSFFAAARVRFLLAAQRLRHERPTRQPRRILTFGSPMRALGGLAAALTIFVGFSTYTVATADAALPGDWRYPVKLQTERVRLALALTDDQKRDVKLDIAEERIHEIERMASRGKIIGPGVLNRLVDQTQPLVDDAANGDWDAKDASRLQQVSVKGTQVLQSVEAQVDPAAQDQLQIARVVSAAGASTAHALVIADKDRPPVVLTAAVVASTPTPVPPTPVPTEDTGATPTSQPTEDLTVTPGASNTPATRDDVLELPTDEVIFGATPMVELGEIKLHTLRAGRLKLLAPGPGTGWYPEIPSTGVPTLIRLQTQDGQSFVVMSTLTGDMYWYVSTAGNGTFDEVQMRITAPDGTVRIADVNALRSRYGADADIPILIMQSIALLPLPPPPGDETTPAASPETTP